MYVISRYENPYEHSPGDTVDKIDLHMLEKVSRGVAAAVTAEATVSEAAGRLEP